MVKYCPQCHKEIYRTSKLCRQCYAKNFGGEKHHMWKGGPLAAYKRYHEKTKHPCFYCGKLIYKASTSCPDCFHKHKGPRKTRQGGRLKRPDGYIYLWMPLYSHANKSGYVLEHIYLWEKINGKTLPKGWVIHHLNGIKDDNRIVNLLALPALKHSLVLAAKAKRIQELEAFINKQAQLL